MGDVWVVGDLHGCFDAAAALLRRIGLVDASLRWSGGDSSVWFIGDLTDRGPDGIGSVELVMRLQGEATAAGGSVGCLLGNHEIFLLAARRFGEAPLRGGVGSYLHLWTLNGGRPGDLERLTADHLAWLSALPAVAREGRFLLVHADSGAYPTFGDDIGSVNARVTSMLAGDQLDEWEALVTGLIRRNELWDETAEGRSALEGLLGTFGGDTVVHGHTPIPLITGVDARRVVEPLVYSSGRCVNVDGGMFLGGPGIAYRLLQTEQ